MGLGAKELSWCRSPASASDTLNHFCLSVCWEPWSPCTQKKGCYLVSTPIFALGSDHRQGRGHLATRLCEERKQANVFLRGHISRMSHMAPALMFQLLESGLPPWVLKTNGGSCVPMNWNLQTQTAKRTPQKSPVLFLVKSTSF